MGNSGETSSGSETHNSKPQSAVLWSGPDAAPCSGEVAQPIGRADRELERELRAALFLTSDARFLQIELAFDAAARFISDSAIAQ